MRRRHFLATASSGLLTLSTPALLRAATSKRVVIIGAGAAGLSAAYHLRRAGAQVQILEARKHWGGRMERLRGFADFPLDMGAEWIHAEADILGRILGKGSTDLGGETIDYRPQTYEQWHRGELRRRDELRHIYSEVKFRSTTWYGFFERFVLPSVRPALRLNAPVAQITYDGRGIQAILQSGQSYRADQALITVPLSILQRGAIRFLPALPRSHLEGMQKIHFGEGFKVFLKFRKRFYADALIPGSARNFLRDSWSEVFYYDAAFGKESRDNILGLFTASETPIARSRMSNADLLRDVLAELDAVYQGQASRQFIAAKIRNWTQEPFIHGSYSMSVAGGQSPRKLLPALNNTLFFGGEAFGGANQATVHGAALSGIKNARSILDA